MSLTETPQGWFRKSLASARLNIQYFRQNLTSRNNMAYISFLAGIASASYGASLILSAAGWIVGGAGLIIFGYLLGQE